MKYIIYKKIDNFIKIYIKCVCWVFVIIWFNVFKYWEKLKLFVDMLFVVRDVRMCFVIYDINRVVFLII